MVATKKTNQKGQKQYSDINIFEAPFGAVKDISAGLADSVKDQGKEAATDFWKQLLGVEEKGKKASGDLQEGEELNLAAMQQKQQEKQPAPIRPGIEYAREIIHAGENAMHRANQEINQQVQEIVMELKRLAGSSKVIQKEIDAAIGHTIVNPGKYHVNFLKWLLANIKEARIRVEDAGSWIAAMQGKKRKKGYWSMFKKHKTSFALSGERSTATQTG
ncbi:MAG: DUF5660 family protein [Candidatus Levyibacteriota bacterium]